MELEYLIMYTNEGIPIYARCFADICKTAISNPTLFSAFLASLNQFARVDPENVPTKLELNGVPVVVEVNSDTGVSNIQLEELQLMFFYTQINEDVTIAVGLNTDKYEKQKALPVFSEFIRGVEQFLYQYAHVTWNNISIDELTAFESRLLHDVVYPYFKAHDIEDTCGLGDNCPFRIAIYEEREGSIFDRLQRKITEYRNLNLFQKLRIVISKTKFPLLVSP